MTSMFWGLRLEPGKRYSTTVDKSFHVSMAALDCSSLKSENEVLSVMLEEDESNVPYILCNLHKHKAMQSRLDLNFMTGDRVTFFCKGNGVVHLSGYIVPEEDEFSDPDLNEDLEEECEEEEISPPNKGKGKLNGVQSTEKRKAEDSPQGQKKKKIEKEEEEEEEESEEESEDDDDEEEFMNQLGNLKSSFDSGALNEESEESDEDESDEEEEVEEAEVTVSQKKQDKKNKGQQQQQQTPNAKQTPGKGQKTPNGLPANQQQQSGKKEKKKGGGETPNVTPKANKSINEEASPQRKSLEGGLIIKDVKIGNGPLLKQGKMATVYYTGKLKSNNKVFDSTTQGPGFKFRVGRGEVIKGWDIGLVGMKVGGKRIINCPPHMAYGQKGSPPSIPPNSALVFEVELKGVL